MGRIGAICMTGNDYFAAHPEGLADGTLGYAQQKSRLGVAVLRCKFGKGYLAHCHISGRVYVASMTGGITTSQYRLYWFANTNGNSIRA